MKVLIAAVALGATAALGPSALAEGREPVLKQIDAPHNYYFREMYLPQVTSGPGAPDWSPDSRELVYSMQGSLWRQAIDATAAEQLTDGPGYDFQPDWSPDGSQILFTRYDSDALELYALDLKTRATRRLTLSGGVNLEPRWSPDGKRIAFVSTMNNGHFHVFVGTINELGLASRPLLPERRSELKRYYYSPFDHELSPTWSPDGGELVFIANPEVRYGTGSLWRVAVNGSGQPAVVRVEETTWRARPDWSPDGKRLVYASYAGRQWHQLWLTTPDGGDPFALTFGEYDATSPRWSPDGAHIAYVANESGDTEIRIIDLPGGRQRTLEIAERRYLGERGTLEVVTVDARGRPVPARVSVVAEDGRAFAPDDAWMHADDGFDRRRTPFEPHYFHSGGRALLTVPAGNVRVNAWRGLEHAIGRATVEVPAGATQTVKIVSAPLPLPKTWRGWESADLHVHMNYGGNYRNTPENLARQARAEDLDVVYNLIVNKEQRIPDIAYFTTAPDPASAKDVLVLHGQEYHTSLWGHLGLLALGEHYLLPDYVAYAGTAAESWYPTNAVVADLAHAQSGLVGYVHPFDWLPDPSKEALTNALPVDVALGKVDYYEAVGFSDHLATSRVWYGLLNCGFRVTAGAGTDAMMNYASLRGPLGVNRVYARTDAHGADPTERRDAWLAAFRAGRTMATNAPLVGLTVEEQEAGSEIVLDGPGSLRYRGFMRSITPIDHLELVRNGEVVENVPLSGDRTSADVEGEVAFDRSGWLVLRAWSEAATPEVFDLYPFGTTNPVYVRLGDGAMRSAADADYFLAWIDDLLASAEGSTAYNTAQEKAATLAQIREARAAYERCR
jgi:hypothetical protein